MILYLGIRTVNQRAEQKDLLAAKEAVEKDQDQIAKSKDEHEVERKKKTEKKSLEGIVECGSSDEE